MLCTTLLWAFSISRANKSADLLFKNNLRGLAGIQPIADRVAKNLEMISQTFPTEQNSAHGIHE